MKVVLASRGDLRCLLPCLTTVVMQNKVSAVDVYMTGEFPAFGDFYLEQIFALADMLGVECSIKRSGRMSVREVRCKMISDNKGSADLLWMIDDDVVLDSDSSVGVANVVQRLRNDDKWAAVTGLKPDVNNRRGYPDFTQHKCDLGEFRFGSYNSLYPTKPIAVERCYTADTGNLVLNLKVIADHNIDFQPFQESANSGGEDTLFAMTCTEKRLHLYKSNAFLAYHLEKDAKPFSEFSARKEMLMRAQESLGYSTKNWMTEFMPFVTTNKKK